MAYVVLVQQPRPRSLGTSWAEATTMQKLTLVGAGLLLVGIVVQTLHERSTSRASEAHAESEYVKWGHEHPELVQAQLDEVRKYQSPESVRSQAEWWQRQGVPVEYRSNRSRRRARRRKQ